MYTIRTASLRDIDDVVDLRLKLLEELGIVNSGDDSIRFRESTRGYFIKKIQTSDFKAWVADSGSDIVSMTSIQFIDHPPVKELAHAIDAHVMDVYTIKDMRGKGVAAELLARVIEYAKNNNAQRVMINTIGRDTRIYAKLGFVQTTTDMELALK
ncbi:MAG TPA: GNAT family N-acetyltransferase [Spirochaetota bacterium]|nr:GNAT family N-acetyltransferase [Spirochaetota bacterium]